LHNRPKEIAPRAARLAERLRFEGHAVVFAYADCGTYGALDEVCERLGVGRLAGLHCYDVFAGASRVRDMFADEPGTYLLTDFLVRSFRSSVLAELGLDRRPELWHDYFAHYSRLVWLAQRRSAELEEEARVVADMFGLPLEVVEVGSGSLELELEQLLADVEAVPASISETAPR
jgi:hypothetical protein